MSEVSVGARDGARRARHDMAIKNYLALLLSLAAPAAADDRAALTALYIATHGAGWGQPAAGWMGPEPPCSGSTANWAGLVTSCTPSACSNPGCSSDGRVMGL